MIRKLAKYGFWALALLASPLVLAAGGIQHWPKTDADFATLPPYCYARKFDWDGPKGKEWATKLGKDFVHVHHYCAAMFAEGLAKKPENGKHRQYYLKRAIGEIGYVQGKASKSFVLMPEILVRKGKVMEQLGQRPEAVFVYREAIKLNPKYGWAHKALADLYVSLGKPEDARKVLQEGMASSSGTNAKWFQQQIAALDEKTPKSDGDGAAAPPAGEAR